LNKSNHCMTVALDLKTTITFCHEHQTSKFRLNLNSPQVVSFHGETTEYSSPKSKHQELALRMAISGFNTPTWRSSTPVQADEDFTGAPFVRSFAGLLFDMDGTIIDSTNAIVKHWEMHVAPHVQVHQLHQLTCAANRIGRQYGVDPKVILATSHGRRSIDVFKQIDPSRATWDCKS
jgi:hypothetical protein